ncbi:hypothetical protein NF699_07895 [Sphingomonadaceae bacterium OTU29LAMAA1]|nr:hypothetical protein NF699_07895 [Sphingomonadaceae bacterium OTU29LAMAA1]
MDDLVSTLIESHGGLARWHSFETLTASLKQGGALWQLKGKSGVLDETTVTVGLRREWASHAPFGDPSRKTDFTPGRVAILSSNGDVLDELEQPRSSFAGHTLETPWTDPQLAYFAGEAMWTYLNLPFLLAEPGVEAEEIESWQESEEKWRRLRVRFPANISTHSTEQILYVDAAGLLKRHDYDVEIAGGTPGAHLISEYREVQGIMVPTRRRIFPRQPDGHAMTDMLVVSIDLDNIHLA